MHRNEFTPDMGCNAKTAAPSPIQIEVNEAFDMLANVHQALESLGAKVSPVRIFPPIADVGGTAPADSYPVSDLRQHLKNLNAQLRSAYQQITELRDSIEL